MLKIILRLGYIKLRFQLNKLTRLVLLCLAFLSTGLAAQENKFSLSSYGDEFSSEPDKFFYFNNLDGVLFLNGTIEKGMYTNFRQAITENKIHTIVLNSLGGNVEEGLNIAGTVFDKGIKTYIPKGYECFSACSFIFLAGSERFALGELGVHQAAFSDDVSKEKAAIGAVTTVSQLTTADILLRLGEFNTPRFVEQRMLRTAPEDMYIFNEKELNKIGNLKVSNDNKSLFRDIDKFIYDLQEYYAVQDCDNDINKCSPTQLCSRAAYNKSWLTTAKAEKYVIASKEKGLSCGVPVPKCPENIKKCNKKYLCTKGTTKIDTGLTWLNNSFANEAKLRGYLCGIVSKSEIKKPTCSEYAWICSDTELCRVSVSTITGQISWEKSAEWASFVSEAKRRGLTCGVNKKGKISNNITIIRNIQNRLNTLGCDAGPADGILGSKTLSALMRWKARGGIYTVNKVDEALLNKLNKTYVKCRRKGASLSAITGISERVSYVKCNRTYISDKSGKYLDRLTKEFVFAYTIDSRKYSLISNNIIYVPSLGNKWRKLTKYKTPMDYQNSPLIRASWNDGKYPRRLTYSPKRKSLKVKVSKYAHGTHAYAKYDCKSFVP